MTLNHQFSNSKIELDQNSLLTYSNIQSTPKKENQINNINLYSSTKESKIPKPDYSPFLNNESAIWATS